MRSKSLSITMKDIVGQKHFIKHIVLLIYVKGQGLVFVLTMTFLLDISVITSGDFNQDMYFSSDELNGTFSNFQLLYLIIFIIFVS